MWAASCTPARASSETVAGCPTATLLMSDSLNATVIVSEFVLTISANPELEPLDEDEPEPPRLPAVAAPLAPEPLPEPDPDDDEELLEEPLEEPPADTASPGVRLESDAIVPLVGA